VDANDKPDPKEAFSINHKRGSDPTRGPALRLLREHGQVPTGPPVESTSPS
jgi:hypothetical protein